MRHDAIHRSSLRPRGPGFRRCRFTGASTDMTQHKTLTRRRSLSSIPLRFVDRVRPPLPSGERTSNSGTILDSGTVHAGRYNSDSADGPERLENDAVVLSDERWLYVSLISGRVDTTAPRADAVPISNVLGCATDASNAWM